MGTRGRPEETDLYYLQSRYYDPETGRFLNSDAYSYLSPETLNGLNLYAYCGNNPVMYKQGSVLGGSSSIVNSSVSMSGVAGLVGNSSPISHTLKGSFRSGLFFGSGSITGFYNDWNVRNQISLRKGTIKLGLGGKFSLVNASGQIGFGSEDLNLVLKAVGDIGSVTGMAGIFIDPRKDTCFVGVEAKATALSGRVGGQLDIFGLQVEAGLSGEVGSIGGKFGIGLRPTDDGKMEFYFGSGVAVVIGWDFYIRIRFDSIFR